MPGACAVWASNHWLLMGCSWAVVLSAFILSGGICSCLPYINNPRGRPPFKSDAYYNIKIPKGRFCGLFLTGFFSPTWMGWFLYGEAHRLPKLNSRRPLFYSRSCVSHVRNSVMLKLSITVEFQRTYSAQLCICTKPREPGGGEILLMFKIDSKSWDIQK